ncbi:alpha/beta hydrolase family protein [Spirillospora sp. CA-294931]|uniref:alpha/beta hydrolase family protein n=1 Tax=Spirillospora sp. CA-294931 TaxID=3240042 RepID=UPI003D8FF736
MINQPSVVAVPRRRRRRGFIALILIVALVCVLSAGATVGIGWYFSGVTIGVDHDSEYPYEVRASGPGTVTLPLDKTTGRPGRWGLAWKGGRTVLGRITKSDSRTVTYAVLASPVPAKGQRVYLDHWVYDTPKGAGQEAKDVTYPSKLGPMPAWLFPGSRRTWVIAVHGHSASRAETLRPVRALRQLGMPVLSIAYRNDVGAPKSADGKLHLGDTEWQDASSAIDYARANGATGVVLYGWSMGGAIAMKTLREKPGLVRAVVLDSPVMDWNATLDKAGADEGLPDLMTGVAKRFVEWRVGIELDDFDQREYAPRLKVPVLLYTTADDATVDNKPSLEFARKAPPGLVTAVATAGDHTDAWNVDSGAYERSLLTFLRKIQE